MVKRIRYIIFIICVFLAGSYVALRVIGTGDFYRTPAEVKAETVVGQARVARVGGEVINSAISAQGNSLEATVIKFELQDGGETVPVVYEGLVPTTFRDGAQVIAEGTFNGPTLKASRVLVKCPETYLPEKALARLLEGTQLENWLYR